MEYLLDTNICIYIIKKKPIEVVEKFKTLSLGSVGISTITLAELQFGVMKSANPEKNSRALNQFLIPFEIVGFDTFAALEAGKIRADLGRKGTPIGSYDTLIAGHALSINTTLVTNNMREFERVPNLKLENWVD